MFAAYTLMFSDVSLIFFAFAFVRCKRTLRTEQCCQLHMTMTLPTTMMLPTTMTLLTTMMLTDEFLSSAATQASMSIGALYSPLIPARTSIRSHGLPSHGAVTTGHPPKSSKIFRNGRSPTPSI